LRVLFIHFIIIIIIFANFFLLVCLLFCDPQKIIGRRNIFQKLATLQCHHFQKVCRSDIVTVVYFVKSSCFFYRTVTETKKSEKIKSFLKMLIFLERKSSILQHPSSQIANGPCPSGPSPLFFKGRLSYENEIYFLVNEI